MKTLFAFGCVASALLGAGCVSTANVALPKARLAQSAGASVAVTARIRPDFSEMKPATAIAGALGGAIGGAIAGATSVKTGNEAIQKYDIADPAGLIAQDLSAHLAAQFRLVPQEKSAVPVNSGDTREIAAAAAGKADFVLDVQTVNWSTIYLPLHWSKYRLLYNVKLRLIDVRKSELVAEGYFTWKTPDGSAHPTYDELYANEAAVLRTQLAQARDAATAYFKNEILTANK